KSQHSVQNVYSPSHGITLKRVSDREAKVTFTKDDSEAARDFQLFYTQGNEDVGLTMLAHRPDGTSDGHFMLLLSPRAELSETQQVARDMVFVLDTSGS